MREILFQNPSEEDLGELYRLEVECFSREAYPPQIILFYIRLARESFIIARDKITKRIKGYVVGLIEGGGEGHIISICVARDYRKRGLGRKLMELIEEYFRSRNVCMSRLEVKTTNTEALRLYSSLGYEKREILKSYYPDGEDAYLMIKRLC